MNIYRILQSKPHNQHYLNRYYKFVSRIQNKNIEIEGTFETHHICPKASDLFPEYSSFKNYPWNKLKLTSRQHFIAHWMLAKAYGGSQIYAFWSMATKQSRKSSKREYRVSSRIYESAKRMQSQNHSNKIKGTKNILNSKLKKGMVACYDSDDNYLIVPKDEFDLRKDLRGISEGNGKWCKSIEGRKTISEYMSDRQWIYCPKTMEHKFVKSQTISKWISKGYVLGYKKTYDRKSKSKECPHCKKIIDPSNYSRWHGDNCKMRN